MCLKCACGGNIEDCEDRRVSRRPRIERPKGNWYAFLCAHREQCRSALAVGGPDEEQLVAQLYDRATDVRALETAWRFLEAHEKGNPGTTGFAPAVGLTDKEIRCVVKHLRSMLRKPGYVPDVFDYDGWPLASRFDKQVGQKAMCLIVEPLLVHGLDPLTLSAGSDDDRLTGLGVTLDVAETSNRLVWAQTSVKEPFDRVPEKSLFDLVWEGMPNNRCVELIVDLTGLPSPTGIYQGCRLSQLLIDFYLDRAVVRKWREAHQNVPILRSGAEFLVLCQKKSGAERMRAELLKILDNAGLPVDEAAESSICDLNAGDSVEWLGYTISRQAGEWVYEPVGSVEGSFS